MRHGQLAHHENTTSTKIHEMFQSTDDLRVAFAIFVLS